jgi:ribonucleoside-diphosphate reductase alpha chain
MNKYPLNEIEEMTKSNRKIGLGVMGFAEMLIKLNIPYNSEEALKTAEDVMSFIREKARDRSIKLALERGSFPNFYGSTWEIGGFRMMRNATTTTIAPTGTISILANTSSGVEPIFALSFIRNVMDDDELVETNELFEKRAKERGFYSEDLMRQVAEKGSLKDIDGIPEDIKRVFVTSHDISPEWHIKMQSAFQKYTDNAVSKTVNFPEDATKDDIREVYELAYELGCKGVTVYRDKSRDAQVLNIGEVNREGNNDLKDVVEVEILQDSTKPRARARVMWGTTRKMKTGCGDLYVTINEDEDGLFEVFAQMGKAGGCSASQNETTGRLISLALRSGLDINSIIKQLSGIRCPSPIFDHGTQVLSCSDAISKALKEYIEETDNPNINGNSIPDMTHPMIATCPDCGSSVVHESGCVTCTACGFSKC